MSLSKDYSLEETLSALMDGEADQLELRRLLKQLPDSPRREELLDRWRRFHVARSVLHGELTGESVAVSGPEISSRILAAIANEPAYEGGGSKLIAAPWYAIPGKLAVAASVTVAVFLGMQVLLNTEQIALDEISQSPGNHVLHESGNGAVDIEAQRRLNEYIQTVSIQHQSGSNAPSLSVFEEIPQLRPVNQIELEPNPLP
jgi:negative regulator of sigma E activity